MRFLAVLELYKQGLIDIEQFDAFGEIDIVWIGVADLDVTELASIDVYDG